MTLGGKIWQLFYLMLVLLVKGNIKSWIILEDKEPSLTMTQTLITAYVEQMLISLCLALLHMGQLLPLSEEFKPNKPKPCGLCNQFGHDVKDCEGLPREKKGKHDELADSLPLVQKESLSSFVSASSVSIWKKAHHGQPAVHVWRRGIDDWVFMCFFVGNDFLPHLPSLEIREGAIDRLV